MTKMIMKAAILLATAALLAGWLPHGKPGGGGGGCAGVIDTSAGCPLPMLGL